MRSKLTVVTIASMLSFLIPLNSATEQHGCPDGEIPQPILGGGSVCIPIRGDDEPPRPRPRQRPRPTTPTTPPPPPEHRLTDVRLSPHPDGGSCIEFYTTYLDRPAHQGDYDRVEMQFLPWLSSGIPFCPTSEPPPAVTPGMAAQSIVRQIDLPVPQPRIEPGRMLVGLRAYLETGTDLGHHHGEQTALGPIAVTARATVTVDWGDGTTTGPHDSPGGPHPTGTITHTYSQPGTYTITVTCTWVADWEVAGATGTIDTGLQTVGTLDDFTVEERQAVITTNPP